MVSKVILGATTVAGVAAIAVATPLMVPSKAVSKEVKVENAVVNGTYATATITTPTDDQLVEVHSPLAMPMLHTTNRKGMVKDNIPFKANVPRKLSKFGYHIMLMSKPKLEYVPMNLRFARAGIVKVRFIVQ